MMMHVQVFCHQFKTLKLKRLPPIITWIYAICQPSLFYLFILDNDPRPGRFGGRGRVLHGQMRGRCYKCGLRGHRAATCDARAVCWLCGRRGHTKVVCPQRQGAQKTGAKPTMQFTNCTFEKFNA
ncbi:ATP-dependent RNA helicase glh-1-like [Dendronephthya gigantea]|uniref:ATP-dependent RNA helicase glh-1-like n=1 Tax=Dendronephthya gigantea TaxID=151771 RepID=UPI00106CE9FA|nr:ATP-dependent RNA helicase glh-1-like [Dendronephthya gigantea]